MKKLLIGKTGLFDIIYRNYRYKEQAVQAFNLGRVVAMRVFLFIPAVPGFSRCELA